MLTRNVIHHDIACGIHHKAGMAASLVISRPII